MASLARSDWVHSLQIWGRFRLCPMQKVEALVPRSGKILDVGCGQGAFAAFLSESAPARQIVGFDIDSEKIQFAHRKYAKNGLSFRTGESIKTVLNANEKFDAIVILDVLYLLPEEKKREVIAICAEVLNPGGQLILKETGEYPAWKDRICRFEEYLAVKVLGITDGDQCNFVPESFYVDLLTGLGFQTEVKRVDQGYLHPHVVFFGVKPR